MRTVALMLLLVGCHRDDRGILTHLPQLGLSLRAPSGFRVRSLPDGAVIELDVRTHPRLRLMRAPTTVLGGSARRLANGAELQATTEKHEGGSGGEEQILRGRLGFAGAVYEVECADQGEWPGPDLDWCIKVLASVEKY